MKDYWKYEKMHSRKDLLILGWMSSIPFIGWVGLLYVMICQPHDKKGKWKLHK